jgi:hypothetical protein
VRDPLVPFKGADVLNYVCIVATELLGRNSLVGIPALAAGFHSILKTLPPATQCALQNIRLSGCAPGTMRELRLMADAYRGYHRRVEAIPKGEDRPAGYIARRYIVEEDLSLRKTWTDILPADVKDAISSLTGTLGLRVANPPLLQDITKIADVRQESTGYEGSISPLTLEPPAPPLYDLSRAGRSPGMVSWEELIHVANDFDRRDVSAGRQHEGGRSWYRRLHEADGTRTAVLLEPSPGGLIRARGIQLSGVKHLIGLPGSGKTTVLYLLAAHLAKSGFRACFLFPSIEVATGFFERLSHYDVEAGILSGQGELARTKHTLNFAATLSTENKGFGVTRPAAPFFATNCALAGFASDEEIPFPHSRPPCVTLMQRATDGKRAQPRLCALSSVCGRQFAERTLISAPIWVGHVLSMDRSLSRLFSNVNVRHFEFLARTFDLLVVDECDGAQTNLDSRGTPLMKLAGESQSLWATLIHDLHGPAAGGRNAFVAGVTVPTILEMTGRFGTATERLTARIMHFGKTFRSQNANLLLTSLSIISDMYPYDDSRGEEESAQHQNARQALERIWDAAVKVVAFRHTNPVQHGDEDDETDFDRELRHAAALMGITPEEANAYFDELLKAIEIWDRDASQAAMFAIAAILRKTANLVSPHPDELFFDYTALLTTVSLLVLQHFGLAPHLRLMNSEGLVSDDVFESRPSRDQLAVLPEALIGRLSGVRYTFSDEGNVDIAQIGFVGTPRMLTHRMNQLGSYSGDGLAVLLTSATSMLEQSPSFHVGVGPDYVLHRPNAGTGWLASKYRFLPQSDPLEASKHLKFSGSKLSIRDRVLKSMVDQLLRGGSLSQVESAISGNDVQHEVGRKAALIVNSYDQCELIYSHIRANYPHWRGRVRYLVRATIHARLGEGAITASEVEQLGHDRDWDLLIFPMSAIGRGVNIVYQFGPRIDKAMVGSLFFLTRPHPRSDSLQLIQGLVGRASERYDQATFSSTQAALDALAQARRETAQMIDHLLRLPLAAQALGKYGEPFVADQMIIILQTIGRAMRGDCPAFVYFVDAAWAPRSAAGDADTPRTSMLVMMQAILRQCLSHPDPSKRECYENLYRSFSVPMEGIENLNISHE